MPADVTTSSASATPVCGAPRLESARGGQARRRLILFGLLALLVVCFLLSLCLGRYDISPLESIGIIARSITGDVSALDPIKINVVMSVRMPRILMALIVGGGLATAGATYQAVFGNPLVSPDILGVSSGAGFGAALGILLSGSILAIQGFALGFGLLAVALVILLGRVQKSTQLYMLVLAGVIVGALFEAFISITKYVADPNDQLPVITTWLMGSLASASYRDVGIAAVVTLPCALVLMALRWKLNLLSLDEEEARSLGVNVGRLRLAAIALATFMTATSVSLCGIIGWVGLVIPHIGRMLVGNDHRALLPASLLLGASYLLLIDDVARTLSQAEIPISILTAIIGAPFFAYLLRRSGKKGSR